MSLLPLFSLHHTPEESHKSYQRFLALLVQVQFSNCDQKAWSSYRLIVSLSFLMSIVIEISQEKQHLNIDSTILFSPIQIIYIDPNINFQLLLTTLWTSIFLVMKSPHLSSILFVTQCTKKSFFFFLSFLFFFNYAFQSPTPYGSIELKISHTPSHIAICTQWWELMLYYSYTSPLWPKSFESLENWRMTIRLIEGWKYWKLQKNKSSMNNEQHIPEFIRGRKAQDKELRMQVLWDCLSKYLIFCLSKMKPGIKMANHAFPELELSFFHSFKLRKEKTS